MKVSNRIISFFLAVAIAFSLVLFAFASSGTDSVSLLVDTASVNGWNTYVENHTKTGWDFGLTKSSFWSCVDKAYLDAGVGGFESLEKLNNVASIWTKRLDYHDISAFNGFFPVMLDCKQPAAKVAFDSDFGVYRLRDAYSGAWLVNSFGHFAFYRPPADSSGDTPAIERVGQWRITRLFTTSSELWHVVSNYELNEFKDMWAECSPKIVDKGNFYWLQYSDGHNLFCLCDKYGYPYFLPKDKQTAVTTPQNYYQDVTNNYVDDDSINVDVYDGGSALVGSPIDINNGIINVGGEVQYIDNINYDASTQTYYVDAHDEYVYDTENNYYTTNNYNYLYQFHINYTSITYIGQTEEYEKRYELYYQLPDGRSSADLTAEDLEQLSMVFADVVPYARSADDVSMRVLYHFDGNTEDSSYWSYCTSFDWSEGASLTYMDEGTFGGSLYLDETAHDFTISLPGNDLGSDFTLQFRYYQSYTAAPKLDSYIKFGSETLFQFNGANYYNGSGTVICATSIGSWNEVCLMKKGSVLYFFINGVPYGSVEDNVYHSPTITFHFGSSQQTYKKIDELRFTKSAVYEPSVNYTPTAVPYDTNLSLILPDGEYPVSDEIMVFTKSENNILDNYGLSDWTSAAVFDHFFSGKYVSDMRYAASDLAFTSKPLVAFDTDFVSVSQGDTGVLVDFGGNSVSTTVSVSGYYCYVIQNAIFFPLKYRSRDVSNCTTFFGLTNDQTYTLSVALSDGSSSSVTFVYASSCSSPQPTVVSTCIESPINFRAGYIGSSSYYYNGGFYIYSESDTLAEIVYMELVEGSESQFSVKWEQAVYSSGQLQESPVLAVRTNRTITGYQIGGVRPSYPSKGLVYAMVENSRIISLQQYTGYAWEEVDGRIWTGERWIPYSSFDVFTLQDFYDIIGSSGSEYEYIYTESGFWSWWQKQWISFTSTLQGWFEDLIAAVGGGESSSPADDPLIDDEDKEPLKENDYVGIVKLLRETYSFLSDFFTDFTAGGIRNFLGFLNDQNSSVYGIFKIGSFGG